MREKVVDFFILAFFLFGLFYLVKNLFFSPYGLKKVAEYRENIENLRLLTEIEKNKTEALRRRYNLLLTARNETLRAFVRDYLFMVENDTLLYLNSELKRP
ncbi:MAG: hypothetical protein GXO08_01140 [Aquificae bacterium]|nr:hypothetical protein [Aquificota bacterium]